MNSRELAEILGVSESTVSRLLSGDRRPSVDVMIKVRTVFPVWSLDEQADAINMGTYGDTLAYCMKFEQGLDNEASPAVE